MSFSSSAQSPPPPGAVAMARLRTAVAGVAEAFETAHGAAGPVPRSRSAAAEALGRTVASVQSADLGEFFAELMRVRALVEGAAVAVLAEATSRGVVAESTATDPASWARQQCWSSGGGITAATANAMRAASELAMPSARVDTRPLFAAVVAGSVPMATARAAAKELDMLSGKVAPELHATAAAALLEWAAEGASPGQLRSAGQAIAANYGAEAFEDEQEIARRHREATAWTPDGAGSWAMTVRTDNEGKAVLDAAFDALAAPMPPSTVVDADGAAAQVCDVRTAGQRRHDALIEVARVVATDPTLATASRPVGAVKAQITVTIDYDALSARLAARRASTGAGNAGAADAGAGDAGAGDAGAGGVGAAAAELSASGATANRGGGCGLDGHGTPLTPKTVRRMACEATIIPAVLGGDGAILDWGRARRLASDSQVAYLRQRDKGCVFPGCGRPPAWCEAHHLDEWDADGGATDVDNLALLCSRHHTIVHAHHLRGVPADGTVRWVARERRPILLAS